MNGTPPPDTTGPEYADHLHRTIERRGWRRFVDPQIPYRWNIRRMNLGRVLDIGCGVGRNLAHLDGNGVGVDHNPVSVAMARQRGLHAFTTDEFPSTAVAVPGTFDTLLVAHVLEHLDARVAGELLTTYLPYVRAHGRVVLIVPQQRGQAADATHVTFFDGDALQRLAHQVGLTVVARRSFPFPAAVGRWFTHNETIVIAQRSVDVTAT